jgi:hypothetical protein
VIDVGGDIFISTDPRAGTKATWVRVLRTDRSLTDISCASASRCVATEAGGGVLSSNDPWRGAAATWRPRKIDAGGLLEGVSCVASLCVAVDQNGAALIGHSHVR